MAGKRNANHDTGSGPPTFALSAGFGSTGAAVAKTWSKDVGGKVAITPGGTGIVANPTITVTFKDGAFSAIPAVTVTRDDSLATAGRFSVDTDPTVLGFVAKFVGTPVSAEVYLMSWTIEDTQ